eukprot:2770783-Amphidinium_carterae.1
MCFRSTGAWELCATFAAAFQTCSSTSITTIVGRPEFLTSSRGVQCRCCCICLPGGCGSLVFSRCPACWSKSRIGQKFRHGLSEVSRLHLSGLVTHNRRRLNPPSKSSSDVLEGPRVELPI